MAGRNIIHHPFFWSVNQRMQFLIAASDYLEFEKPTSDVVLAMDSHIHDVVNNDDWTSKLDPLLLENLGKYRKYPFVYDSLYNFRVQQIQPQKF